MRGAAKSSWLKGNALGLWFLVIAVSASLCGCVKKEQTTPVEAPQAEAATPSVVAPAQVEAAPPEAAQKPVLPPPLPDEIKVVVARVYDNNVTPDVHRCIVGDFDGDDSQDLVVVVRPVPGRLPQIQDELARWQLEDPKKVHVPDPTRAVQSPAPNPEPVHVSQGDELLVIIHGNGPVGWRDPEANNTYLLKNGVGVDIKPLSFKETLAEVRGQEKQPGLRGDVITERLGGERGFLYYTGARYAWYRMEKTGDEIARKTGGR